MSSGVGMLTALLFLLDVGGAQVLATGKSAGAEIDFKYAIIGTALGFAISAGFLALKICIIRKHLSDNDTSDLKSTHLACNDTIVRKKRTSRDAQVIEL
ncbi:transmembrane protein 273 isoform X1 [Sciurus carolinensis]|uniref:transmembrane protein 273 isoform X1 n=1 Tax=Sciurus carolinensis TaxID=30640 RepID=UPI001FB1ACFC|nr:transmembrane protein 273 isoform X1 [Sciurus carolinensis]